MAGGWSKDGGVQDQIDASIEDAVKRARNQLPSGHSNEYCEECDTAIPQARREAIAGVKLCVRCQELHDESNAAEIYNRRGSKDSQLR
jgi:phage/conjugal plasmid C-4 type zinc finger TraR family protein